MFQVRKNTIFEKDRFNHPCQGKEETAEQFITSLFAFVDKCNYSDLRDELIWDRLVIGIKDAVLSERLQMDAYLTLNKIMKAVRQREAICKQQSVLHKVEASSDTPDKLDSVRTKVKLKQTSRNPTVRNSEFKACSWCGKVTIAVTSAQ